MRSYVGWRILDFFLVLIFTNLTALVFLLRVLLLPAILLYIVFFAVFVMVNVFPAPVKSPSRRLRILANGGSLLAVCIWSFAANIALQITWGVLFLPSGRLGLAPYLVNIVLCLLFTAVLLLNGIIRVSSASVQLGIKWRVLLILCWWVPIFHLFLFYFVCKTVREECELETEKLELDAVRQESSVCATRYPILLVHGVFFRDRKYFNYWGRVPKELIQNGAVIYYGGQESAASVADSAAQLAERIRLIVEKTGCGRVNIIAHSKGGLDARYAISRLGMAPYVASLTTVNTPHRGCAFADYLLGKAPATVVGWIARRYNGALRKMGDQNPDFCRAVEDLTVKACTERNQQVPDMPGVFYQSTASRMRRWTSAPFPLCISYLLVRHFSAENDGLVDIGSARWGSTYRLLDPAGRRGISHGDMIDLYRKNIRGFDVREFYVGLVKELKDRGL